MDDREVLSVSRENIPYIVRKMRVEGYSVNFIVSTLQYLFGIGSHKMVYTYAYYLPEPGESYPEDWYEQRHSLRWAPTRNRIDPLSPVEVFYLINPTVEKDIYQEKRHFQGASDLIDRETFTEEGGELVPFTPGFSTYTPSPSRPSALAAYLRREREENARYDSLPDWKD